MNRNRFLYGGLLAVLVIYILIAMVLMAERSGIRVEESTAADAVLLPVSEQVRAEDVYEKLPARYLVIADGEDEESSLALEQFDRILRDMKTGYALCDLAKESLPELAGYDACIVLLHNFYRLGEQVFSLTDYVSEGGRMLFALTLEDDPYVQLIERRMGIISAGSNAVLMDSFYPSETFMLGGGQAYAIVDPFESSRAVQLDEECTVYAWNRDEKGNPLVWTRACGKGRFVVDNFGICEKADRGFFAASISLLEDFCVWPVLNGAVLYLDDFPSPVPGGDGTYIRRDYQMSVADFYANVWWPDLLTLAENYNLRYTGVIIENYEDDVSGDVKRQEDVGRFQYFGNMLLHTGGEIGFHGYNHQPLSLSDESYKGILPYKPWADMEAMEKAVAELSEFAAENFPTAQRSVYVPPSNVISAEGLGLLAEKFPHIRTVASTYFPGEAAYTQEFGISPDGMVEQPRIVSGAGMGDYEKMVALSELNMHLVFNHFMHPDDLLDEDRGAALGWEALKENLTGVIHWLFDADPSLRRLTGTELSASIQRWCAVSAEGALEGDTLELRVDGLIDSAFLMLRLSGRRAVSAEGADLTALTDSLYLLEVKEPVVKVHLA